MSRVARPLSEENFGVFGTVLTHPAAAGRSPIWPILDSHRASARPTMGLIRYDPAPGRLRFDSVERHPASAQLFFNLGGGTLLVAVAPSTALGRPDLDRLEVFVCGAEQSFGYHPGVWHAPLSAIHGPATVASLLCRDGSDGDVEIVALSQPIEVFLT